MEGIWVEVLSMRFHYGIYGIQCVSIIYMYNLDCVLY